MDKKYLMVLPLLVVFSGCSTSQVGGVNDVINSTIGTIKNVGGLVTGGNSTTGSYSVSGETIHPVRAEKTSVDYGKFYISYEKNPNNRTRVLFNDCSKANIGKLKCSGYMYEETKEGWLREKSRINIEKRQEKSNVLLAAGKYYVKIRSDYTGRLYYATGSVDIKPHVTNVLTVVLH